MDSGLNREPEQLLECWRNVVGEGVWVMLSFEVY